MPLRHILVFTDGRPVCERALRVGASLAQKGGGRLTILHVAEPLAPVPGLGKSFGDALVTSQLEEVDRLRAIARSMDVDARCRAATGRPFVEIIRACRQEDCDLVVKAAKGRGRLGWPILGSTALHLVRKCPALVWLVGEEGEPIPRRVMALLSSDPASDERQALDRRVLEVSTSLADAFGADLSVGAAWDAPGASLLGGRMPEEKLRAYVEGAQRQAEAGLGRALEPFAGTINPARVHLVRGVPYVELAGLAAQRADLAVIGTTPPSGSAAFLIREEAEEVINRLETSIVAVKPEGFVSPIAAS